MKSKWPEGHRGCRKCHEVKPFEAFDKHSKCFGGYNSVCKECRKPLSTMQWAKTTPEYRMWHRAKFRARREDLPFDISISDIEIPEVCPVLGVPFIEGDPNYTTSLDKIVPSKGYVKGNIIVMTNRANKLKNDATTKEIELLLEFMRKHD